MRNPDAFFGPNCNRIIGFIHPLGRHWSKGNFGLTPQKTRGTPHAPLPNLFFFSRILVVWEWLKRVLPFSLGPIDMVVPFARNRGSP